MKKSFGPAIPPTAENALCGRIIGAAFESFMGNGYAGTSMHEIARRAKVSKRDLYANFPSKQALRDHIEKYIAGWNEHPTPFIWTKPADAIIKSHRRMSDRISHAVH